MRAQLEPGESVTLTKLVAYAWSGDRELPALRDELAGALTVARHEGFDGLLASQRAILDGFWECADVEVDGDAELQQAVRFALFQLLQATARAEGRAIAGKALTGTGYEGHAFWDTETFVLQVMTAVRPEVTRHALGWRHATLPAARDRARTLDLKGAAFPWRTITGPECSGYWPAGTAAFHVNADIADAVLRYVDATGDEEFAREAGVELLVETARLWCALGHWGRDERFHVFGVTGPDEYSALGDDNVYTNLMLQRNLRGAARWARRYPDAAEPLEVTRDEIAGWEQAADAVCVPYDDELGVHPQSAGFTRAAALGLRRHAGGELPAALALPVPAALPQAGGQAGRPRARAVPARRRVHRRGEAARLHLLRGDHRPRLVAVGLLPGDPRRRGGASAPRARVRRRVGARRHPRPRARLVGRPARRRAGRHVAGARLRLRRAAPPRTGPDGGLSFRPVLPDELPRLRFRLLFRGRLLRVTVEPGEATYELLRGEPLTVRHEARRRGAGRRRAR